MTTRHLVRADLMSLERYHQERAAFRRRVLDHKRDRQVLVGPHISLTFEDALTIQYQIQEMLRVERIFEADAIEEELAAYNPLIPDGDNWKATMMIEYEDIEERRAALERMVDIEDRVWIRVGTGPAVWAIPDEDLDRHREGKTAAVHFLRFQLEPPQVSAAKAGVPIAVGVEHSAYRHAVDPVSDAVRRALIADLA